MEMFADIPLPVACLVVGYLFGMFLTADVAMRVRLGQSAFDVGSRNPGMANAGKMLGVGGAAVVLAGDILKVVLACAVASLLTGGWSHIVCAWTGLGTTLGHNLPAWHRFRGGKGVTTTCSTVVLMDPALGFVALIAGFVVAAATKYLPYGAIGITVLYSVLVGIAHGPGTLLWISLALLVLMAIAHGKPAWRAIHGEEPQVDFIGRFLKRK